MASPETSSSATALAAPDVTVVVMAYDEAASLESTVLELLDAATDAGRSHELLIVDDGSRDGTAEIADRLAAEQAAVSVVRHPENRGLGGVYRSGFDTATGRRVTFFSADGQFPASILTDFLPLSDNHDLVLGYLESRRDGWAARILSAAERLTYALLVGRVPRFQGVFMLRRAVLDEILLTSQGRGWGIVMEMILRVDRAGYRTVSVPTTVRPRRHGNSKVRNLSTIWQNLKQLIGMRRQIARSG